MSTENTWSVTYHNGDVDDITAHAFSDLGNRAEWRDEQGELIAVVAANTYRSIIRLDALVLSDDDFDECLADWEQELLAGDEQARKAAEGIARADITAVFTLTDGRTVKREFQLDNVDEPILTSILAELDITDVTKPEDVASVFAPGDRRAVRFRISGRGPVVGAVELEPVST